MQPAADVPEPTPEDLRAEYDGNPEAYTAPERRAVTAGWLDVDAVAEAQEIDEAALRDVARHVVTLAQAEDLPAHGEAVTARFGDEVPR